MRPVELAWNFDLGLDLVASSLRVAGDLDAVCPWRKKKRLLPRMGAHGQALESIEQPWRAKRTESSHEVCTRNPA
jgi:hypothetical protein